MTIVPQPHPLYLAVIEGQTIHAGHVIAWNIAASPVDDSVPIVAFTRGDGEQQGVEHVDPEARSFLAASYAAAVSAAKKAQADRTQGQP